MGDKGEFMATVSLNVMRSCDGLVGRVAGWGMIIDKDREK